MKVALLTTQSRVAPVFATATTWLKIEATVTTYEICSSHYFKNEDEADKSNELLAQEIELIICGAIPYYLEKILINQGCKLFSFIAGDVDQVLKALHLNLLDKPKFKMPGCQKRKKRGENTLCKQATQN